MAKTITKGEAVLKTIKRGPKKGLTAEQVSERTGVKLSTVRAYLQALKADGYVSVVGTIQTKRPGRPALRYVAA